ncbi:MAG: alpha/beta fold hydrolase, partial [Pirellulaceae bacterium]
CAAELAEQREKKWSDAPRVKLVIEIGKLLGMRSDGKRSDGKRKPPTYDNVGRIERDGYTIDKLVLKARGDALLPALAFRPSSPAGEVYLYLHDEGKVGDTAADGPVEELVNAGYTVITVDLRGQGETASQSRDALLTDWKTYYLGYLLGRPLVGTRVIDTLDAAYLAGHDLHEGSEARQVHLVGVGQAGIVALHAAALVPERFASVTLRKTPHDWASVVEQDVPSGQLDSSVHGALEVYDLPDLVRLAGEDKVRYED